MEKQFISPANFILKTNKAPKALRIPGLQYLDQEGKTWSKAQNMGKSFNDQKVNGIQSITPDGNTIMVFGAYEDGVYKGVGFSLRHRTPSGWTKPQKMVIDGLEGMVRGLYLGGYLANSGKEMILYFSEQDGSRNNDLYVTKRNPNGTWSRPENLGRRVNGRYSDSSPFIASDNSTLYFASDRPGGKGGFDIYVTKRLDESWLKWSVPQNIGPPVNTEGFEANYTIPASGDYAYLSSEKDSYGASDLVRVKLDEEDKPDPVALLSGVVLNTESGDPLQANISVYLMPEGTEVALARSFEGNGGYQTTLPTGSDYMVIASKNGFESDTAEVKLRLNREYQEVERSFGLKPGGYTVTSSGKVIPPPLDTKLSSLYFDTGRIDVKKSSREEMERVLTLLQQNPTLKVWIQGHADIVGTIESNDILGENRAKYVRAYLIANGIPSYRLKYISYGNMRPATSNRTAEGRRLNRRVEIHYDIYQE